MRFHELPLAGAWSVVAEPHDDERGYFARIWAAREFADNGLAARPVEVSVSHTSQRLTLRGLHYQAPPHEEVKLVTCVQGTIWDVIVDLRRGSPTFRGWHARELSADRLETLYVPEGFAHGFLTLTAGASVLYQISAPHEPHSARGVRWNDPVLGIDWPAVPQVISDRDRGYPDLEDLID